MTDIWEHMPDSHEDIDSGKPHLKWYFAPDMDPWLEKVREQLRDARAQSRVHGQHRILYQAQRNEARRSLEAVKDILSIPECISADETQDIILGFEEQFYLKRIFDIQSSTPSTKKVEE